MKGSLKNNRNKECVWKRNMDGRGSRMEENRGCKVQRKTKMEEARGRKRIEDEEA